jgi:Cu/Ag efflux protein CusF
MKISQRLSSAILVFAVAFSVTSTAQEKAAVPPVTTPISNMIDGEIRKIDMENKKITIKHGEIKKLDMPGMTMVFQVKDGAMLDKVKAGDKVKFAAEKLGGAFVVVDMQLGQ